MAIVKRASGSWKSVIETLWKQGIKVEDLSQLPGALAEQKKAHAEAVKVFEKERSDLKISFEQAMAAFSSEHEAGLLVIQEKFAQKLKITDEELMFNQEQGKKLRQKNFLVQLLTLKTTFDLWQRQNSLKSKRNKLIRQREKEIKAQNKLYESKQQKARTKNFDYQSAIERKVKREKVGVTAIDEMLKSGAYYGALAEVKMIELLSKLPDNYYVLNDVTLKLDQSIRFDDAWLSSTQIDHLVISPAGVFVIEVKNWSEKFSSEGNFFDPYRQVKRHKKVCDILLKSRFETTVRSIIAYAGHIPAKTDGSYTRVLPLEKVGGYILEHKDIKHDAGTIQKIAQLIERKIENVNR